MWSRPSYSSEWILRLLRSEEMWWVAPIFRYQFRSQDCAAAAVSAVGLTHQLDRFDQTCGSRPKLCGPICHILDRWAFGPIYYVIHLDLKSHDLGLGLLGADSSKPSFMDGLLEGFVHVHKIPSLKTKHISSKLQGFLITSSSKTSTIVLPSWICRHAHWTSDVFSSTTISFSSSWQFQKDNPKAINVNLLINSSRLSILWHSSQQQTTNT